MSKIGLTVLRDTPTSALSAHFGKAKWILIHDSATGRSSFVRNRALVGAAVAQILAEHECTDAVFAHIGPGGLNNLRTRGIRAWRGPKGVPAIEIIAKLQRGELRRVNAPPPTHAPS